MNTDSESTLSRVKLDSSEVAFCIKKFDNTPNIGVYIPTLMSEVVMLDHPYERKEALSNSMLKNKDRGFSFDSITLTNYYKVGPYDPAVYYTEVALGEQVRIKFLENDIKKCYYYDDTYKMTDALMENSIDMQKQIDELNEKLAKMEERMSKLEEMNNNDNE